MKKSTSTEGDKSQAMRVDTDGVRFPSGSGVHVYEVDSRILVRAVDGSDRMGIERDDQLAVDGYPEISAADLGRTVLDVAATVVEVPRPTSWPTRREYALLFITASPRRYRSWRQWQMAARSVSVHAGQREWELERMQPDLGRGGWLPVTRNRGELSNDGWPQKEAVPFDAPPQEMGAALLRLLEEPPMRGDSHVASHRRPAGPRRGALNRGTR